MEELGGILPSALSCLSVVDPAGFDETCNILTEWTLDSLNVQSAMSQPETPFKVRHLKMGIKFAGQILLLYDALTIKLLVSCLSYISISDQTTKPIILYIAFMNMYIRMIRSLLVNVILTLVLFGII